MSFFLHILFDVIFIINKPVVMIFPHLLLCGEFSNHGGGEELMMMTVMMKKVVMTMVVVMLLVMMKMMMMKTIYFWR